MDYKWISKEIALAIHSRQMAEHGGHTEESFAAWLRTVTHEG
jgi:hypothetical protein